MAVSPTLILQASGTNGTQVSYPLIINPNVLSYNNYITNQRSFYERTIGGTGWTQDQIANQAILAQNLRPQNNRVIAATPVGAVNSTLSTILATPITTTFANANINLNYGSSFELNSGAGDYLLLMTIDISTSPTFTTFTTIKRFFDTISFTGASLNFRWKAVQSSAKYTIATAGTYYIRTQFKVDRYNGSTSAGTGNGTGDLDNTYIEYSITNGFTV
jgi:hypothetical protein